MLSFRAGFCLISLFACAACSGGAGAGADEGPDAGGTSSGGANSGGTSSGGASSGGASTGGASSGGANTGGSGNGPSTGGTTGSDGAVVLYTDLASAPLGAFVTLYGKRLASAAVTGATVISQNDEKIVLEWEGDGAAVEGVPVAVSTRSGAVKEATPATLGDIVDSIQAGDVVYLHAGTYSAHYGTFYGDYALTLGDFAKDTAFIGYPGETAKIADVRLDDGRSSADGVTIANLTLEAWNCVHGGGYWENEESGAIDVRVVNVRCHGNYGSANTMTGLLTVAGDGWRVFGNQFTNDAPEPINNNHGIYIQVGADNVEVAWNHFSSMKVGHVIQIHTDGPERAYQGLVVHDNEIIGANPMDTRGIVVSNCTNDSTVSIFNNVILNAGQDFSGIAVYCGQVDVFHNTLSNIHGASLLLQWGSGYTVNARNNVFIGDAIQNYTDATLNESDNVSAGSVDSNGILSGAPTAPNVGIDIDHAGRPRGATVSVGAFEP